MRQEVTNWIENKTGQIRVFTMATMACVALTACGKDSIGEQMPVNQVTVPTLSLNPEQNQQTPIPSTSTTESGSGNDTFTDTKDCSWRTVNPGENFSEQKRDDIEKELGLLSKLEKEGEKIKLDDLVTAGRILKKSYDDPLYAEATAAAGDTISNGKNATVDQFLQTPVNQPEQCDADSISTEDSKAQLKQTATILGNLTSKLSQRIGERASANAKNLFEMYKDDFTARQSRLEEEQRQP